MEDSDHLSLRQLGKRATAFEELPVRALLDHFDASEVLVTERVDHETRFRRLDTAELAGWMERYTLSELYDKNIFGGRP